jgi:hypothetical protein
MNLIILVIIGIIGIIIYLVINCNIEKLSNLSNLSNYSNINESNKCCEIKKIVLTNNKFAYNYKVNEDCRRDYNSNFRNIFENEIIDNKPFTLDKCSNENNLVGSCRRIGFECVDFVTPEDCKKYKMTWSDKTCHDKLQVDITYPEYSITSDIRTIIK